MTRVVMYQAADGTLFKSLGEKTQHEATAKLNQTVKKAIEEGKLNLTPFTDAGGDYPGRVLHIEDLQLFVVANADALRKILGSVKVANRGRPVGAKNKPKKTAEVPQSSIPTGVVTHSPTVQ